MENLQNTENQLFWRDSKHERNLKYLNFYQNKEDK